MGLATRVVSTPAWKLFAKYYCPFITRHGADDVALLNLHPASDTGLDLNPAGIDVCRKTHSLPGLDFVQGNAENLPFEDQSFDAVINIEASHCYPSLPGFLAEVARVLRPGGRFLYADVRRCDHFAEWEAELADAPLRMCSKEIISEQVVRGLEKSLPRSQNMFTRRTPAMLRGLVRHAVATSTRKICHGLRTGESSYRMCCFEND